MYDTTGADPVARKRAVWGWEPGFRGFDALKTQIGGVQAARSDGRGAVFVPESFNRCRHRAVLEPKPPRRVIETTGL